MDEDKTKKELENNDLTEPQGEKNLEEEADKEMTTEEHLRQNRREHKQKINFKAIGGFILMMTIIVGLVLILMHFCEDTTKKLEEARQTSSKIPDMTYTKATTNKSEVEYVPTTTLNNPEVSTKMPDRKPETPSTRPTTTTSHLTVKPQSTATTTTTTTTTTTSTTMTTSTTTTTSSTTTTTTATAQ